MSSASIDTSEKSVDTLPGKPNSARMFAEEIRSETEPQSESKTTHWSAAEVRWTVAGLVLPLLGMSPMLWLAIRFQLAQTHLQFFPLATLLSIFLLFRTTKFSIASSRRLGIAIVGILISCVIAAWGIFDYRPWTVHVAAILVSLFWAIGALGTTPITRIIAICSLMAIGVRLPLGLDVYLVSLSQQISSWATSGILDTFGIPNLHQGNYLFIKGLDIDVSRICGGIDSIFALFAVGLAVVVLRHRPLATAVLVVGLVPIWLVTGFILRLLIVSLIHQWSGYDLTDGVVGTITSFATFGLAALGIILTDITIAELFAPIEGSVDSTSFIRNYNSIVRWPKAADLSNKTSRIPAIGLNLVTVISGMLVLLGLFAWYVLFVSGDLKTASIQAGLPEAVTKKLQSDILPASLNNYKKTNFEIASLSQKSGVPDGINTSLWKFNRGDDYLTITVQFPNTGWTDVKRKFSATGQEILSSSIQSLDESVNQNWQFEELLFKDDFGTRTYGWVGAFDQLGNPIQPKGDSSATSRNLIARLNRVVPTSPTNAVQVQLLAESRREIGGRDQAEIRQIFTGLLQSIRSQYLQQLNSNQ